jgi:tetratricopeptide (TPR) repeat protein
MRRLERLARKYERCAPHAHDGLRDRSPEALRIEYPPSPRFEDTQMPEVSASITVSCACPRLESAEQTEPTWHRQRPKSPHPRSVRPMNEEPHTPASEHARQASQARAALQQAARNEPESPRLASLRALLAAEPDDGFVLYGLAQECHKLGRFDDAIAYYDRAIAVDPKQCYAFFHKAKTLESARRHAEIPSVLRAGLARARAVQDFKAASEIQAFLDDVEDAV